MAKNDNQIVLYKDADGGTALDVRVQSESVWLSLNQIAELFKRDKSVVSRHIHSVFKDNELERGQLLHFLQQLPLTANPIRLNSLILMSLFPSAIVLSPSKVLSSGFGQTRY